METLAVDLHLANSAFESCIDSGLLYAEKAAAAGITINVVREPDDGYWSNVWMQKPFTATYWGGRPTQDWMFTHGLCPGRRVERDLLGPRALQRAHRRRRGWSSTQARRQEMYSEMQRLVRDEGGIIIPMFANYTMALSDKVAHPEAVGANWILDGFRAPERWWFS